MASPLEQFRTLIDRAFNAGDLSGLDALVAPTMAEHQFSARAGDPAPVVGPGGVAAIVTDLHRGAPDFHLAIEDAVCVGDTVWARLRGTGTDTGGMFGQAPTGRAFDITVLDICRYEDGRMVEHWGVPDRFRVLEQLDLLPTPAAR